jgi:crotonobetainyl-CoA:carnitine CoA-transferase CaiB-like acyl-CoA transferase
MADNQALPLARYRVLDLTRARAGPTCVRQLVDWGAQAIKIEMPGGRAGAGRATASTSRPCTAASGQ